MSGYEIQPLEESPEVAAAVADDTTVPQLAAQELAAQGPAADDTPEFRAPVADGDDPAPPEGTAAAAPSP